MCREPKGAKHMLIPRCAPWLPPTQKAGKDGILRVVRALAGFLPINTVTVEVGAFDLRALAKPDLSGAEYQQGSRYGQDSTLAALVAAYGPKCCYCGKVATAEDPLTIDHWEPRAQGGTDRWGNLVAAHRSCNEAKGARTPAQARLVPRRPDTSLGNCGRRDDRAPSRESAGDARLPPFVESVRSADRKG